jgi:hypothetical protein
MANEVAYGFQSLLDIFGQRVTTVDVRQVVDAVQRSVDAHVEDTNAILNLFAQPTTDHQIRYLAANNVRNQPLDEFGRTRPIKPAGYYDIAFPIVGSGNSWGTTYVARVQMTVEEMNRNTVTMLLGDTRWVRDHALGALFASTSYTYSDPQWGVLTVLPLANGDTQTYAILSGADAAATDNHLLFQAAAISDAANPFPTLYTELIEHPENSGVVIAFVATNLMSDIQTLTTYNIPLDPDLQAAITADVLTGRLNVQVPGTVRGKADQVWIVEWPILPASYILAVTGGGDKPLAMRQYPQQELQGFVNVEQKDEYPYYLTQYQRYLGFGARNRVGAAVMKVGSGSYSVPTGYGVPMP